MLPEWFLILLAHSRHFGAELADAVAGSLSHGVVVGLRLGDVELAHLVSVCAHDLFALLAEYLSPSVIAVHSDAFCHVVPVQAHSGDE